MIHLMNGADAAKALEAAFELDENLRGPIVILNDHLEFGPLQPEGEESLDALRTKFHAEISGQADIQSNDEATLLELLRKAQEEEEPVCFWMAPNARDACTYYWLLPYFKAMPGVLHSIQIPGLPFLNEKGQLFYPTHFGQVPAREFLKTKRLLKELSPADFETDGDEWQRLQQDGKWIRTHEGGKKLQSKEAHAFDHLITSAVGTDFQRASRVLQDALKKTNHPLLPVYMEWRLRQLIAEGKLELKGDSAKPLKDFEVRKAGEVPTDSPTVA